MISRVGICIFLAREPLKIALRTLHYALAAAPANTTIDLVVNGNSELSAALAQYARQDDNGDARVRVWSIGLGDKANAWNRYLYEIWSGESVAFFMDGYVMPQSDAIALLADRVMADGYVLGGSGVPSSGRRASSGSTQSPRAGGFQGNLCCIKGTAIEEIRARGIKIPIGLYWSDGFIGALLTFGLDPRKNSWDSRRIAVLPTATWTVGPRYWWRASDLASHYKRLRRQARGRLENRALQEHVANRRLAPELLPARAETLVRAWAAAYPREYWSTLVRNPLALNWAKQYTSAGSSTSLAATLLSDRLVSRGDYVHSRAAG